MHEVDEALKASQSSARNRWSNDTVGGLMAFTTWKRWNLFLSSCSIPHRVCAWRKEAPVMELASTSYLDIPFARPGRVTAL
jgi:hypothetical protein